jgi:hypothetical protein
MCIAAAELARRVEERLARQVFVVVGAARITLDGWVARSAHGYDVMLEVSEVEGQVLGRRELHFESDDCRQVADAVALVIAVTLYPDSALPSAGIALDPETAARFDALFEHETPELDPTTLAAPPAAPVHTATELPPSRALAAAQSGEPASGDTPLRLELSLAAGLGLGHLPGLGLAGAAYAQYTPRSLFPVELGLFYFAPRSVAPDTGPGSASFSLIGASLAACPLRPFAARGVELCVGAEAGFRQVAAREFASADRSRRDPVLNVRLGGVWHVALWGPLALRLALLLSVPVWRRDYVFRTRDNTQEPLFRMPPAAVSFDAGLAISL